MVKIIETQGLSFYNKGYVTVNFSARPDYIMLKTVIRYGVGNSVYNAIEVTTYCANGSEAFFEGESSRAITLSLSDTTLTVYQGEKDTWHATIVAYKYSS